MRIGSQKALISIYRRVQVGRTEIGEPNWVWQEWLPEIWCEVSTRRGKEHFDAQSKKRYGETVWHFRTRLEEALGVDETMQISHEGNRFKIRAVLPDAQSRRDVVIECILEDGFLESKPLTCGIEDTINLGIVGLAYDQFSVSASGGTAPYYFSAASLPPGLQINATTGLVSGTPSAAGTHMVSITVTDSDGGVETLPTFEMSIEDP